MPDKEELSEEINEMLGTDIDWHEMLKDDLKEFHGLVERGALLEPMAKHVAKNHGTDKLEDSIDDWYPGKFASSLL